MRRRRYLPRAGCVQAQALARGAGARRDTVGQELDKRFETVRATEAELLIPAPAQDRGADFDGGAAWCGRRARGRRCFGPARTLCPSWAWFFRSWTICRMSPLRWTRSADRPAATRRTDKTASSPFYSLAGAAIWPPAATRPPCARWTTCGRYCLLREMAGELLADAKSEVWDSCTCSCPALRWNYVDGGAFPAPCWHS